MKHPSTPSRSHRKSPWAIATISVVLLSGCTATTTASSDQADAAAPFGPTTPAAVGPLDQVRWMLPGEPTTLDSDVDATTQDDMILANVCDRLMQLQPDLSLGYSVASATEWVDDKHLVLTIRQDATFHDGSPLSTDDVVWSMQRHAAEGAAESDEYKNVVQIEKSGTDQITVTTTQRDAIFLQAMAGDGGIVWNPRVIESEGDKFGSPTSASACSGPYVVESWEPGSRLTLVRNDSYWQPDRVAKTERVVLRWADEAATVNSLTAGEVDGAYFENPAAAKPFLSSSTISVYQGPSTNAWVLEATAKGALVDPRLRQALSLAINRTGVASAAFGGLAQPWKTPVGPGAWGYENALFEKAYEDLGGAPATPSDDDIAAAKKLIAEAGTPTEPLVVATNGTPVYNVVANALLDAARKIGLEAEIMTVPEVQYFDFYNDETLRNQADLWPDVYYISKADPLGFYKNGKSDSGRNFVGYNDPEYDRLVDEGYATTDDEERANITIELEKKWVENEIWIPVVATPATVVLSAKVTGVPSSASYLYYPWAADLGSSAG